MTDWILHKRRRFYVSGLLIFFGAIPVEILYTGFSFAPFVLGIVIVFIPSFAYNIDDITAPGPY